MMALIQQSGVTGWVHMLLAVVILAIAARRVMQLAGGSVVAGPEWDASVNGILFWGGFAAVMGVLSQTIAICLALTAIRAAMEVDPWIVLEGFMISFTSTLIGLAILTGSALIWYALKSWGRVVVRGQST